MPLDIPASGGLDGKVAIVTGAGALNDGIGNGRAAAILLAVSGARVLCVDRDLSLAEQTVAMIEEAGGDALACEADVTQASSCESMVSAATTRWGRLDILDRERVPHRDHVAQQRPTVLLVDQRRLLRQAT